MYSRTSGWERSRSASSTASACRRRAAAELRPPSGNSWSISISAIPSGRAQSNERSRLSGSVSRDHPASIAVTALMGLAGVDVPSRRRVRCARQLVARDPGSLRLARRARRTTAIGMPPTSASSSASSESCALSGAIDAKRANASCTVSGLKERVVCQRTPMGWSRDREVATRTTWGTAWVSDRSRSVPTGSLCQTLSRPSSARTPGSDPSLLSTASRTSITTRGNPR